MTTITKQEVEKFRSELGDSPELQNTVDTLEECAIGF
jgi:hypothetical protein